MSKLKTTAFKERQTKAQIIDEIADATEISKKEIRAVLCSLAVQAERHLKPRACGEFIVPELGLKLKTIKKPARKARKGVNPFTGEEIMIQAKPASKSVRAIALKAAKTMAG